MKVTIDFEAKTIECCDQVNLSELTAMMKKHFPEDWKMYTIHVNQVPYYFPVYPIYQEGRGIVTVTTTSNVPETYCYSAESGVIGSIN